MRHADRPLDPDAIRAADEKIYAAHAKDKRPNALFDAAGRRLKLSATAADQKGLRDEWWKYYFEALDAKQKASAAAGTPSPPPRLQPPPKSPPQRDEREAGNPRQPCPNDHWITVIVTPDVWDYKRPTYWPPYPSAWVYASEPYAAQITNGSQTGKLDSNGGFQYYCIPAGVCSFRLTECLNKVAAGIQKLAEYNSEHPQPDS